MATTPGLTYVFDQNFSSYMLDLLRLSRAAPVGKITSLKELGFTGDTPDTVWLTALGARKDCCAITRDGAILQTAVERQTWVKAGVSLLVLDKMWGQQSGFEIARRLLFWWPYITAVAEAGKTGDAWTVSHHIPDRPSAGIRLVGGAGPQPAKPKGRANAV